MLMLRTRQDAAPNESMKFQTEDLASQTDILSLDMKYPFAVMSFLPFSHCAEPVKVNVSRERLACSIAVAAYGSRHSKFQNAS
jgi:hypothetical protein